MSDGIDKKIVGQRIKNIRLNLGLTQAQFADKLYIANNVVCGWEKGRSIPNASIAQTVAEFGDMNASDLLNTKADFEKMWRTLKESLLAQYPHEKRNAEFLEGEFEYGVCRQIERTINRMDEMEGTDEFINLLRNLERGNNEF